MEGQQLPPQFPTGLGETGSHSSLGGSGACPARLLFLQNSQLPKSCSPFLALVKEERPGSLEEPGRKLLTPVKTSESVQEEALEDWQVAGGPTGLLGTQLSSWTGKPGGKRSSLLVQMVNGFCPDCVKVMLNHTLLNVP